MRESLSSLSRLTSLVRMAIDRSPFPTGEREGRRLRVVGSGWAAVACRDIHRSSSPSVSTGLVASPTDRKGGGEGGHVALRPGWVAQRSMRSATCVPPGVLWMCVCVCMSSGSRPRRARAPLRAGPYIGGCVGWGSALRRLGVRSAVARARASAAPRRRSPSLQRAKGRCVSWAALRVRSVGAHMGSSARRGGETIACTCVTASFTPLAYCGRVAWARSVVGGGGKRGKEPVAQTRRNLARRWLEGERGALWEPQGRRLGCGAHEDWTTADAETADPCRRTLRRRTTPSRRRRRSSNNSVRSTHCKRLSTSRESRAYAHCAPIRDASDVRTNMVSGRFVPRRVGHGAGGPSTATLAGRHGAGLGRRGLSRCLAAVINLMAWGRIPNTTRPPVMGVLFVAQARRGSSADSGGRRRRSGAKALLASHRETLRRYTSNRPSLGSGHPWGQRASCMQQRAHPQCRGRRPG